ncbi:glycosyltransferase family 2 protein [Mucilaginibacter sp.]|uniref:glycosyltransferase family 2 protein n=1 Tax=Mucilaginibacter sp. TaxID=1882438 RepID=UPI00263594D3|nr:glycosyltransferase family 2 protein [Mucilaginibacter sp.]MDB4926298.1 glycosyltransferase family 2 protein [Mucilaginibacter sp.]
MHKFLLTIAIPTYNRSGFLKRNLEYLYLQKESLDDVELIVSDNASTDNTNDIVDVYISLGLKIEYIRNAENRGADFNVAQCYLKAQGRYVLALGDDDFLINGSIAILLKVLSKENYGVVFFNNDKLKNTTILNYNKLNYTEYTDPIKYIKKVNLYITFISGNIINRQYLNESKLLKYQGSNLNHVSHILDIVLKSSKNLYIHDILLTAEPDNTGGYNLVEIFGENFNLIISELDHNKTDVGIIKKIINNSLLVEFFPIVILKLKLNKNHTFVDANPVLSLKPLFKGYFNFWLCCYPLFVLPNKPAIVYSYFIKIYAKIRRIIS